MKKKLWLLACVWAVFLFGTPAWADFYVIAVPAGVGTRITSLPYTITTPGFYYLARDLTITASPVHSSAISVNADNVTIDLMGFGLVCSGSGDTSGISIWGRKNVEVRNGTVTGFPASGIYDGSGGYNYRIINVRVEKNGIRGIDFQAGYYHLVQNCNASENGNSGISLGSCYGCMVTGNVSCKNGLRGIACTGAGHSLIGNVVVDNTGHGFYLSTGANIPYLIDRNTAYNNSATLNGTPPDAKFGVNAGPGFP